MKKLILLLFIPLVSFGQTYKIEKNYDGSYEVTDTRAAQRMLIEGAYTSAPKFKSYRINPSSNQSYNKSSSRSSSNYTNNNYIIVLNQSEKSYASESNSNVTNEIKKSDNSDKKDYKYVKTYKVKTKEQIQREYKEKLEARQKQVNIIYEFNYQSLNNQDVTRFFIVHNENAYRYWGGTPVKGGGVLVNKSDFSKESIKARVNLFIKSINEYSDFGGKILEYPMTKPKNFFTSSKFVVKPIKNENKVKALTLEDEDLLYRYNKLYDELQQYGNWYDDGTNGEKFVAFHKDRNKAKRLQPKLNEVIAEINSKYAKENKQYLVIEYDSGYIGEYRIPSKYIKIKNPDGRVLYEAIYKNFSMIELVEELFVN